LHKLLKRTPSPAAAIIATLVDDWLLGLSVIKNSSILIILIKIKEIIKDAHILKSTI